MRFTDEDTSLSEDEDDSLPEGADVAMRFPDENTSLPEFSFRWPGNNESWLPKSVNYHKSINTKAFVNTGQNLYNKFDTFFDAGKGFGGIRETEVRGEYVKR
jgi:hypothetical protein